MVATSPKNSNMEKVDYSRYHVRSSNRQKATMEFNREKTYIPKLSIEFEPDCYVG